MKLSQIKSILKIKENVNFKLINWDFIPEYFHVTEIWLLSKKFIDCGWFFREDKVIRFQLWVDQDFDHRLKSSKLLNIINISQEVLWIEDLDVEIEYQTYTIGIYTLDYINNDFILIPKFADCLSKDRCGIIPKLQDNVCCWSWSC